MRSLLLSIILTLAGTALPPAAAQTTTPLAQRIESSAKFYQDRDGFVGVIEVQRDHHLLFGAGFGYADLEHHIPFDLTTRFRIGSLSKQFTAAATRTRPPSGADSSQPHREGFDEGPAFFLPDPTKPPPRAVKP
jgi:CubicO group peptidase (beta-lactamase class C family)